MKLSEITVEDLRKDHDAFVEKMKEVSKTNEGKPCNYLRWEPADQIEHDPNWREKLRNKSPFDDT